MKNFKSFLPHIFVFFAFIIVSVGYFHPILSGKEIMQGDIVQYVGMAKEQIDYRDIHQKESYWNNSAFGGMPTYQLGAKYPHNYIKQLDAVIRFLPRPADYLFIYFIGFYILLSCLRVRPLQAFLGALAFGFSTYLIVIIGAGHNAKAHAIGYMPLLIAGVLLVFRKKYISGGIVTIFAAALEINANHFQMTYYLMFLLLIIGLYYTADSIKNKTIPHLIKSFGILFIAAFIAIGTNATNLLATQEYASYSSRSKSELTTDSDGNPKQSDNAMSHEYITEYSYGFFETFNLFSARIMGGGNRENFGKDSNLGNFIIGAGASQEQAADFSKNGPGYWGDQPIVVAPAYIGAGIIFLAILALYIDKRKIKYIFLAGAIVSILLSWGKNFFLTDWMIDHFPLYNKFRAIASIQVIAELCIPVLAFLGLQTFIDASKEERINAIKKSGITAGLLIVFLFISKSFLSFSSESDAYLSYSIFGQEIPEFLQALKEDRSALYTTDVLRTLFFIITIVAVLYFFTIEKLQKQTTIALVGIIAVIDLIGTDLRYVNKDNFVASHMVKEPFQPTAVDLQIKQDTTHYRVYERNGAFNSARTSFFHQSIGGYHAAKPKKIQELYDFHIAKNNIEVLNMLNVKYVIDQDPQTQQLVPLMNNQANGNAWFVTEIKKVENADEAIQALSNINTKKTAIIEKNKQTVNSDQNIDLTYKVDSLASIKLIHSKSDELVYESSNPNNGVAVFSEIYYPHGWIATIDGKESNIFEADYTLRALAIPAGKHKIIFRFEPEVVAKGSTISLFSCMIMAVLVIGGMGYLFIKNKKENK